MLTKLAGNILQVQFIEPGVLFDIIISYHFTVRTISLLSNVIHAVVKFNYIKNEKLLIKTILLQVIYKNT